MRRRRSSLSIRIPTFSKAIYIRIASALILIGALYAIITRIPPSNIYIILITHVVGSMLVWILISQIVGKRKSMLISFAGGAFTFLYAINLANPLNLIILGSLVVSIGLFMYQK